MAVQYNPGIVTDGLVLCLDAANPKSYPGSGVTCSDLSNNISAGSLQNGTSFNSANGGSFVFDGSNDRIQLNSPFGDVDWGERAWSASFWGRASAFGDRAWVVLNSSNNAHYCVNTLIGYDRFWVYYIRNSTSSQSSWSATLPITTNQFFNLVMIYNGNGVTSSSNTTWYCNGSLLTTLVGGGASVTNESGIQLGGTNYPYAGNIYSFSLYNRVLTQSNVTQNFNALRGRFGI
jgi:hypothetical protein